jgi:hypothetical protein
VGDLVCGHGVHRGLDRDPQLGEVVLAATCSFSDQEPGPLRWPLWRRKNGAAFVRDTDRTVMPLSSWIRMVLGITDRNCRLLP